MTDLLKRVINANLAVVLLAGLAATLLRVHGFIPPEVWKEVVNTALTLFVGGGLLRDGLISFANKGGNS